MPMMDCPGYAPTVLFSILSPKTRIPPHSSVTNARLVVHLPSKRRSERSSRATFPFAKGPALPLQRPGRCSQR